MLPSENELAQIYSASRVTVRKSLQTLETDNLIYAWHGKGYFVANPEHDKFTILFSENEQGYEVVYRNVRAIMPTAEIREALDLPPSNAVIEVKRIIKKHGTPVALDIKYIPHDKGRPNLEAEMDYAVFPEIVAQKTAPFAFRTEMKIEVELPTRQVAADLNCSTATPLLVVYRWFIDQKKQRIGFGIKYMLQEYGGLKATSGYDQ